MIKLNPIFKQIMTTEKRYVVITGGRGSSKSFSMTTMLCLLMLKKLQRVLFTRYTMTSAHISIIPEFREKIDLLGLERFFNVNQREIESTATGSDILFRGIKTSSGTQTAALKSIQNVTTWVLDEAEEMVNEKEFDTIDLSIRSKRGKNTIILILNPTTKEHFIFKRWFENHLKYIEIDGYQIPVSTHPDILHIHTTYLDNLEHLHESFLDRVQRIKESNPVKYRHTILGGWLEKEEGVVFEDWQEGEFNEMLPYCHGLDWGYFPDPLAMVKVAIDRKKMEIYVKEVFSQTKIDDVSAMLQKHEIIKSDLIVCDTSEPRTRELVKKMGYNIQNAVKELIKEDIREMKKYKLIIDPKSPNLKIELNNYVWNDKKASIPIDKYNHLLDALRYAFRRLAGKPNGKKRSVAF